MCLVQMASAGGTAEISIDRIEKNDVIQGRVKGLKGSLQAYKVVVYVHTDKWYIHPYARQGDGLSFASIKPDGTWEIETVKRKFSADSIAVLVVNASAEVPDSTGNVRRIPNRGLLLMKLSGTPSYGRL